MARQPKTAAPKQKFTKPCMECNEMPRKSVINGRLILSCGCGSKVES